MYIMVVFNYLKHLDAWDVKNCLEHTCADQYIEEKEKEKKGMIWCRNKGIINSKNGWTQGESS